MTAGLHPIDAANRFAASFEPDDRIGMTIALRDLAIALRREAGQSRRQARAEVDAALTEWGPDDDLRAAVAAFAVRVAACWTPEPRPPLRFLGAQLVEVELVAS